MKTNNLLQYNMFIKFTRNYITAIAGRNITKDDINDTTRSNGQLQQLAKSLLSRKSKMKRISKTCE